MASDFGAAAREWIEFFPAGNPSLLRPLHLPVQLIAFAASLGPLVTVAVIDYATGYEVLVHLFYLLPVAISAWFGGRYSAWSTAIVAAVMWATADYFGRHHYSNELFRYWNLLMFFGTFVVVGELIVRLKQALDTTRRLLAEKETALRELDESTLQLRKLEGSFQTMCAWTNQIKDGDEWVNFQEFLYRRLRIRMSHSISPEGLKRLKAQHEKQDPPPPEK